MQRRKLNCLQFALDYSFQIRRKTVQSLLMAEIKWWKKWWNAYFFSALFPLQAILNTFIIVCDTLLKKMFYVRKNSVYCFSDKRKTWHKARNDQKFSFRNIFHWKIAIFPENVHFHSGKSKRGLPAQTALINFIFSLQRTGKLMRALWAVREGESTCRGEGLLLLSLAYPGDSYDKRERGRKIWLLTFRKAS